MQSKRDVPSGVAATGERLTVERRRCPYTVPTAPRAEHQPVARHAVVLLPGGRLAADTGHCAAARQGPTLPADVPLVAPHGAHGMPKKMLTRTNVTPARARAARCRMIRVTSLASGTQPS